MKTILALLSIVFALSLGACSTQTNRKEVLLQSCDPGDPGRRVILLDNSYAPEGRVVRIAH